MTQDDDFIYFDKKPGIPVSVFNATKLDPSREAEVNKLAKERNLPNDVVSRNLSEVKQKTALQTFQDLGLATKAPKTNEWFEEPKNARVAYDKAEALSQFEMIEPEGAVWDQVKDSFTNFGATSKLGIENVFRGAALAAMDQFVPDKEELQSVLESDFENIMQRGLEAFPFIGNPVKHMARAAEQLGIVEAEDLTNLREQFLDVTVDEIKANEEEIGALTPENLNVFQQGLRGGIDSLVRTSPGLAMSLVTRNPSWMLTPMTGMVMAESYGNARAEGYGERMSGMYAILQGGIEFLTEKIPADQLLKIPGVQEGWKAITQKGANYLLSEQVGEQMATFSQSLVDYAYNLDEELEKANTLGDWMDIWGTRAAVTSVAALTGSLAQGGIATTYGTVASMLGKKTGTETVNTAQHLNEQEKIDKIIGLYQSEDMVELLKRDPEALKSHAEQVAPNQKVYLSVERVMQMKEEGVVFPESIEKQIEEADSTGDNIAIPLSEFVTDIIPNEEVMTGLRDYMKLTPDGTFKNDFVRNDGYLAKLLQEAEKDQAVLDDSQRIYDEIREKLIATGRQGTFTSQYSAQLIPAYLAVRAKEFGVPVQQLYDDMNVDIVGPEGRPVPDSQDMNAPRETIMDQVDTTTQNFRNFFGESKVVDEKGEPLVVYHGTDNKFDIFNT
jgi:hypothetical protein